MADPPQPRDPAGDDNAPDGDQVGPSRRDRGRAEPPDATAGLHDGAAATSDGLDQLDDPTEYAPPGGPAVVGAPAAAILDNEAASAGAERRARRAQRRNRRRAAAAGVAALLVLVLVGTLVLTSGGGGTKRVAAKHHAAPVVTTTTTPGPALAVVATTKVPSLQVFDQPVATGKVVTSLSAKTDYQQPRTLLVENAQTPGWLQVWLPMRPNDTQGWIRSTDVTTSTTDLSIKIQLSAHHLWLTKLGQPVLDTGVAIGKTQTPTPTGVFYITDPVDLQAKPNGAYGVFALGLSGYSNVLTSFEGGPGQIAIHGTPYAEQAGQEISNGCVRVPNAVMLQLAKIVPLGTPVFIVA